MIRKVQCQRDPWLWEAQHPHRLAVAKRLQDSEERTISRSGDFFEHGLNRVLPNFAWNHTLVLEEALRAVHPVPLEQVVQRVEKRLVVSNSTPGLPLFEVVVGQVEGAQRQPIDQGNGWHHRHGQLTPLRCRAISHIGRVAAHEQAAPAAPCNAVNPGHRVFPIGLGIVRELEKLVQVGIGHGLGV